MSVIFEEIRVQDSILRIINRDLYHINRLLDGSPSAKNNKIFFEFDGTYTLYNQNNSLKGFYTKIATFQNRGQLMNALGSMLTVLKISQGEL